MKVLNYYSCDFETLNTNETKETYVWLACGYDFLNNRVMNVSFNIEDFMNNFIFKNSQCNFYFHNLSFDGNFILNYLINNGFTPRHYKDISEENTFFACIDNMNNYYYIEIITTYNKHSHKYNRFMIYDSLKLIPFSEDKIAKDFKLPILKGKIDYNKFRSKNYIPTSKEIEYIVNDTMINGLALKYFRDNNLLNGFTIGQVAMKEFKKTQPHFRNLFPKIDKEIDDFLRLSYKGGWTYLNPIFKDKVVNEGVVYDANSLYPSQMLLKKYPYGQPIYFKGKPNGKYELFIVKVIVDFTLKENHLPSIQIKNNFIYNPTEYLSCTLEKTELVLTSVDLKLLFNQYNINYIEYVEGYYFNSKYGIFNDYVNKFSKMKIENDNNGALRTIAKLFLNNLYGQLVKRIRRFNKVPFINDNGVLNYVLSLSEEIDPVYTACGSFITSYGRYDTITNAQRNYDRFIYADTDSLHLLGLEDPKGILIDKVKFGYWKKEKTFEKAKFIRSKTYLEISNGITEVKCCGLPIEVRDIITIEEFKRGAKFNGKLAKKSVKGGIILEETTFTIKE